MPPSRSAPTRSVTFASDEGEGGPDLSTLEISSASGDAEGYGFECGDAALHSDADASKAIGDGDCEGEADVEEAELSRQAASSTMLRRSSTVGSMVKYDTYALKVDPLQEDRAAEIKLCTFARPHMRAFHFAWWCYHVAFLMWFAISPLLSEVETSLRLSREQIWTSSIAAVTSTIIMRFVLGPFCDKYGPRIPMGVILLMSAIPCGMIGLVNTATGLSVIRFFIGVGGSTFVMAQYWTTRMFTKEWVGTANATVGGWGNLGGGITQLLVGSFLFPVLKHAYGGGADGATKAWRTACVVPSLIGIITAYSVIRFTDDSPHGNYSKMKKQSQMEDVSMGKSFRKGALNFNTWLLFVQYACCFGVEITMNNAAALYFKEQFGLTTESAAAVASIFGWMNLFARGLGGFISDKSNGRWGMRGRLWWHTICLLVEGTMVIVFAYSTNLGGAIAILVFFSIFVQAAEGSTYGIVPYVNPHFTGSISGIIGAGGNTGSFAFSFCFRQMSSKMAFVTMGIIILCSSVLSVFISIKGHPGLICHSVKGSDKPTGSVDSNSSTAREDHSTTMEADNTSDESRQQREEQGGDGFVEEA